MSILRLVLAAVVASVLASPLFAQGRSSLYRSGNIEVKQASAHFQGQTLDYYMLLRDSINFGHCFLEPKYRRLAVTYYHPHGPTGCALQRFNWFPGLANAYAADARLPASVVGMSCPGLIGSVTLPVAALWSEPAVAVIGLSAGTPASYARPLQPFHFFESNKDILELNQPAEKNNFFFFLSDARRRGADVRVIPGSPREQLRERGPRHFYHVMILEACTGENGEKLFLDLLTREGIAQCMEHLVEDGVLCVHISHRFVDLAPVLGAIGKSLNLAVQVGRDNVRYDREQNDLDSISHFTSEWVFLARRGKTLETVCVAPAKNRDLRWEEPRLLDNVWTDKGPNLLHGVLRGHPFVMRYQAAAMPVVDFAADLLEKVGVHPNSLVPLRQLSSLPRPLEQILVDLQLRHAPHVDKLWP